MSGWSTGRGRQAKEGKVIEEERYPDNDVVGLTFASALLVSHLGVNEYRKGGGQKVDMQGK